MTCEGCAAAVKKALLDVYGVESVEVHLRTGMAEIKPASANISLDQLILAVKLAGYSATLADD